MKTLIDRIQAKSDIISRRYRDDLDFISVFTCDDKDSDDYGLILVEFNEWGGPKMRNGKIIGDHDSSLAEHELNQFLHQFGARLEFYGDGDDIEHHKLLCYRVIFDSSIK